MIMIMITRIIMIIVVIIITMIIVIIMIIILITAFFGHSKVVGLEKVIVSVEIDAGDLRGELLVVVIGEGGECGIVRLERIVDGFAQRREERVPLGQDVFRNLEGERDGRDG